MAFFADIRDLGYKVWCKTDLTLGHIGENIWSGNLQTALDSGAITYPAKVEAP